MRRTHLRCRLRALYVASYVPRSRAGRSTISNHGGMDTRREWVPAFVPREYLSSSWRPKLSLTGAGFFYVPLLLVDQLFWHRTDEDPEC